VTGYANCFKKTNLLPQMYDCYHRAIEIAPADEKENYKRKLLKTYAQQMEKRHPVHTPHLSTSYLKRKLKHLYQNLQNCEKNLNSGDKSALQKDLYCLNTDFKNYQLIHEELVNACSSNTHDKLRDELGTLELIIKTCNLHLAAKDEEKPNISPP